MEIAKRLNAIIAQLLPFLSQEVDIYNMQYLQYMVLAIVCVYKFYSKFSFGSVENF